MKKLAFFALAAVLVLSLCACRMGGSEPTSNPTTNPATEPPATTVPEPSGTEPAISIPMIDPTLDTNIPDPSVDDSHLMDPTEGGTENTTANP